MGYTVLTLLMGVFIVGYFKFREYTDFKRILANFKAESRVAEVLVTESRLDEFTKNFVTTIKFLEYAVDERPLEPKYFTFRGNQIQFQSLVVRFADDYIEEGHRMKGKSVYLFLKAFVLDGANTQVFDITPTRGIPGGYEVGNVPRRMEQAIWNRFWAYALDPKARDRVGIKNAQLEAPGSVFVPGTIYTIKIEHDGGLRIDAEPIPHILKGERIMG